MDSAALGARAHRYLEPVLSVQLERDGYADRVDQRRDQLCLRRQRSAGQPLGIEHRALERCGQQPVARQSHRSISARAASPNSPATGGTATINQVQQDGFAAGQLQSVAVNNSGLVVGTFSNGQNLDLAAVSLSHFNGTNYLKAARRRRLCRDRSIGCGDRRRDGINQRIVGRKFEHRYRRRIHQADRDPAGLLRQHQGDHHGANHGSGSLERAAVTTPGSSVT